MKRHALIVLALLLGCDDGGDPEPPNCADWLQCYDHCNPWSAPAQADAVGECDVRCRAELEYNAADASPNYQPPEEWGAGPKWKWIVAHDREAARIFYGDAPDHREVAGLLAASVNSRGDCVVEGLDVGR